MSQPRPQATLRALESSKEVCQLLTLRNNVLVNTVMCVSRHTLYAHVYVHMSVHAYLCAHGDQRRASCVLLYYIVLHYHSLSYTSSLIDLGARLVVSNAQRLYIHLPALGLWDLSSHTSFVYGCEGFKPQSSFLASKSSSP